MLLFLTAVIALSSGAYVSASPEELIDAKYIILNDPGYLDFFSGNVIASLEFGLEDGIGFTRVNFVPLGVDPFIYMPINVIREGVNCDEYPYVAISVRAAVRTGCNLYYGTSQEAGLDESKNIPSRIGISGSNDWETVVFYCGEYPKWSGTLSTARFDPYGTLPEGVDHIDIRWMAFVKNEEDLEKLDVSLEQMENNEQYTRMPIYSTPDRTKPPENTFRPSANTEIIPGKDSVNRGFSPAVLIIVSSLLVLSIAAATAGIILLKKKNKNGSREDKKI
ncbi:MAG: hypothetical protein J5950_09910 [Clostridia bacterium]|nr:hypothetical protein [Clostridia bacterium]